MKVLQKERDTVSKLPAGWQDAYLPLVIFMDHSLVTPYVSFTLGPNKSFH